MFVLRVEVLVYKRTLFRRFLFRKSVLHFAFRIMNNSFILFIFFLWQKIKSRISGSKDVIAYSMKFRY